MKLGEAHLKMKLASCYHHEQQLILARSGLSGYVDLTRVGDSLLQQRQEDEELWTIDDALQEEVVLGAEQRRWQPVGLPQLHLEQLVTELAAAGPLQPRPAVQREGGHRH